MTRTLEERGFIKHDGGPMPDCYVQDDLIDIIMDGLLVGESIAGQQARRQSLTGSPIKNLAGHKRLRSLCLQLSPRCLCLMNASPPSKQKEPRMSDRTKDREMQLQQSKPYVDGAFVPGRYSVGQRDTYHFDIFSPRRPGYVQWYYRENPTCVAYPMNEGAQERAFAIRGEPGRIFVRDERWDYKQPPPRDSLKFPSVESAFAWITATLLIKGNTDD